jgi:predicted DNA repair protein MutK
MMFEANLGQAETTAAFVGRGPGYAIHFDGDGISLVRGQDIVRMDLKGATPPHISGVQPQEGRANYFIGKPDQWITAVPLYAGVQYRGVYPGVDLVFYSSEGELEYDFTLAPGASASTISLAFRGIDEMRIDGGDLVLKTGWGELRHRRPRIYQMRDGQRSEIAGRFVIRGPKEAGFETEPYPAGSTLVIDPVMAYGTYIGGTGEDSAWAVAADSAGDAYVVGETWSVDFPKTFTISTSSGNGDAFIIKLNPSGTGVLYATYFGGNSRDSARGVAVDPAGNAYVTGFTYSSDFPATAGAYRSPSLGQPDAFAIKVNPSGSGLVYSALIGGAGSDFATGIAIDTSGNAYIAGYTSSVAFPVTSGGFQKSYGGGLQDAFVAKLNSNGSGLTYCTYLGGSGNDVANGIAVDAAGEAYIVGYTDSVDFPTRNPIYANYGGQGDAFVAKLTPAGDSLVFSTYLGGSLVDIATAVALDSTGNVYVTGATLSANFPVTSGAFQTVNQGSYDAFVSKISSQGTSLLYSTYVGGEGSDQSSSIAVDANGVAYIAGFTYSFHFPLQSPIQSSTHGVPEAFVAAVGPTGSSLVWSTYLGGSDGDQATGVAVDPAGSLYVAGSTFSSDFPTKSGAYRAVYAGDGDGFLVKLGSAAPQAVSVAPSSGTGLAQTFAFTAASLNGSPDVDLIAVVINSAVNGVNACYFQYQTQGNSLSLANDAASAATIGTLGGVGVLANSQCQITLGASSATWTGNSLTLSVTIAFKAGLHGTQNVYMIAANTAGLSSSWQQMGTWTIPSTAQPPVNASLSPTSGTGAVQTFAFTTASLNGSPDVDLIAVVINSAVNGVNACYFQYQTQGNSLSLANDAASGATGGILGGVGVLANSQCQITLGASSATWTGNSLTLSVAIAFKAGLHGTQNVYMIAANTAGLSSSWQQMGTWAP